MSFPAVRGLANLAFFVRPALNRLGLSRSNPLRNIFQRPQFVRDSRCPAPSLLGRPTWLRLSSAPSRRRVALTELDLQPPH